MRLSPRLILPLIGALALGGCFETKQEFTLNPDGSGKVVQESIFSRSGVGFGQNDRSSLDEQMQDAVKEVLTKSKGVEAWRDISFRRLPDGRIHFRGIAYFPDIKQLGIKGLEALSFNSEKSADGTIELSASGSRDDDEEAKTPPPSNLSAAELADRVMRAKVSLQESRPMLIGLLKTVRHDAVFHLPGGVTQATNFHKVDERTVSLGFDGAKVLAALDALAASEEWWRARVRSGADGSEESVDFDDPEMTARIFGQAGPVKVNVRPDAAPQFDYPAEVAAAKIEYAAFAKRLGFKEEKKDEGLTLSIGGKKKHVAPAVTTAAAPGALQNVHLAGMKAVYEERGLRFGGAKGLTLGLRATLPEKALHPIGGEIKVAAGEDGASLRPAKPVIEEGNISLDEDTLSFEVDLALPAPTVLALQELSGTVDYYVAGPTRKTDFGLGALKAGGKGAEAGAEIKSLEQPANGRRGELRLKVSIGSWRIKGIRFLDGAGRELKVSSAGSSWSGDSADYTYSFEDPLPADARLEAEIFDPLEKHQASFKVEGIPLPRRP